MRRLLGGIHGRLPLRRRKADAGPKPAAGRVPGAEDRQKAAAERLTTLKTPGDAAGAAKPPQPPRPATEDGRAREAAKRLAEWRRGANAGHAAAAKGFLPTGDSAADRQTPAGPSRRPGTQPPAPPPAPQRTRRQELADSLFGPDGETAVPMSRPRNSGLKGGPVDIQSMSNDYPAAVGRLQQVLEDAHNEVAAIVAGLEQAPINPGSKEVWRELSGMLSGMPQRVSDADGVTRQADAEFWRELADGNRPNGQAWGTR